MHMELRDMEDGESLAGVVLGALVAEEPETAPCKHTGVTAPTKPSAAAIWLCHAGHL